MEQNQQGGGQGRGRRGNFHRGRRGSERRGPGPQEPRAAQSSQPSESQPARGDQVDVEQIMRDIRARIAQRHGIDLSAQQIQELAARRLEAILDPRNVNPNLLDQLRKAAGDRSGRDVVSAPAEPAYTFEDTTIYDTHRGLLRAIRNLLNPILRLFFNPNPIVHALNAQARLNAEQAARDSEREQRQAEWNALHYELLRRVVNESAKLSIEVQALTLRVESLSTRVDFADRRVRTIEAAPAPAPTPRHGGRPAPPPEPQAAPAQAQAAVTTIEPRADAPLAAVAPEASSPDGQRKRRRRRRGRRSGGAMGEGSQSSPGESFGTKDAGQEDSDDASDDAPDAAEERDSDAAPRVASQDTAAVPPSAPAQAAPQVAAEQTASAETTVPADNPGSSESPS